ncbi:MAG: cell division ATP-binding protein FtsE [Gammaproteobacteria bacterium]|nr:cell division ATP-binding protein FtsE [Gammaproteobacteria bacterium]
MIKFERVSKRYAGGHQALADVTFHLEKGDMVFLTGHSGAGKSTLLRIIMKMEDASQGNVIISGQNLAKITKQAIAGLRQSIGMIFQNPLLLPHRTVFENVALPLYVSGMGNQEISHRVRAALDKVGLLTKEKCSPTSLSAGEQQRVGIARAVVNRPAILLADEPTGNLDPHLSTEIMKLFEQFNQVGTTVLIATHDLGLIAQMKYPILGLKKGNLSQGVIDA